MLSLAWGSVIRQLAAGLGIELDGIEETYVREPAPEDFDIAAGHIERGPRPRCDSRWSASSTGCRGRSRARHPVARRPLPGLAAARSRGGNYRIEGHRRAVPRPGPVSEQQQGDHNHAGLVATAMRIVNAIPAVVAPPRHTDHAGPSPAETQGAIRRLVSLCTT